MGETGGGLWGRLRVKVTVTGPRAFRQGWKEARDAVVASMAFSRSAVLKEAEWPVGLRKSMAVWETPGWPGWVRALRMAVQMIRHSVLVARGSEGVERRLGQGQWGRGAEGRELGKGNSDGVVSTGEGNRVGAKGDREGIRGVLGHGEGRIEVGVGGEGCRREGAGGEKGR
eukprot:scaffold2452_cov194-Amphora_coffeaeformis.AAC.1